MSVVILEQPINTAVEIAEGVGVLPTDARHGGAAGATPGILEAFVRNRPIDRRELVILILAHGRVFSGINRRDRVASLDEALVAGSSNIARIDVPAHLADSSVELRYNRP